MSGYIISLALLLIFDPALSQTNTADFPAQSQADTILFPELRHSDTTALRIGVNLVRPLMTIPEPSRFGIEAVADVNIGPEYFALAEAGLSMRDLNEPTYHLKERGMFFRIGAERNFYPHFNDVIALGARLGFSFYDRSAPFVSVEQNYWNEYSGSLAAESFFRQWAEVVFALKTELFSNVFLGWNLRGKVLLLDKGDRHIDERYIPGFGAGTVNSTASFDFYLYYRIPIRKMK